MVEVELVCEVSGGMVALKMTLVKGYGRSMSVSDVTYVPDVCLLLDVTCYEMREREGMEREVRPAII